MYDHRDLHKLKSEIELYQHEERIWAALNDEYPLLVFETKTSTGYLVMHLI
jgi:hypothetical protein